MVPHLRTACVPVEIQVLLNSSHALGAIKLTGAKPGSIIRFDSFRGEARNCDLLVKGECKVGAVLISIEAKADESFGNLIGEAFDSGAARERSRVPDRIRLLTLGVLGRDVEESRGLRYQLLHGIAGALTSAKRHGAKTAVFLVHEFLTTLKKH
jgi:hypothetical protein